MSLNYLPLPVYVSLCLFLSIALILIAVKRRNVDRKGLLVLYLIGSAGGILATIIRILKERTSIYDDYFNQIGYILFGYIILLFADIFYISMTQKVDKESRKKILIGWVMIAVSILAGVAVYFILD
ncbi:MAG TPA: hypothetical protein DEF39_05080 [Hungateiclostridium thermocellum]|jgi:hypothetical protein|uniref:Uncharacterized protein n=2 Tax=Acetivibrio thermocellus TaxID=1515 RepID=A3DBC3_ACET2|nr:hypothetical protein [Acetivibrio thermocellus]CDG34690.1 hypothetical protein CTHBC1_0008 [Acetivibrio thermocellus BC1]ABN51252.1 hypothetical protein Cthe_0010 [Acetivibrio thermocellus ATCC 27405]ADU75255.1 hypothetical protein Clo1313_2219 [Acetivibrio thermocellus DSM 1313]ALX09239.1 hypothetical protein AD2_02251 [Acetivibrio thermocellus AD2]ANV76991.1 hypothetical protein LQRI_2250 [Acetivibrio thermocellus DSM 2360]